LYCTFKLPIYHGKIVLGDIITTSPNYSTSPWKKTANNNKTFNYLDRTKIGWRFIDRQISLGRKFIDDYGYL
jgi:hypothetical protein